MKNIRWFTLVSFLFCTFTACTDSGMTPEEKEREKELEAYRAERDLLDSIVGGMSSVIQLNHSSGGNGTYISDGFRPSRNIDTTIEISKFVKDMIVEIRFSDPTVCNYKNTKFLLNGKEIKGEQSSDSYGRLLFSDIFEKQDETHRLEIQLDSANCGNLKETYTLVPSKNPGEAHFTEVCYNYDDYFSTYVEGYFYSRVIPCYYGGFYSTYADTLQSRCFLKTESESMELKIDFEKDYDIMNSSHYQRGEVSLDSATLVNFLNGDTSATLSCALIFQDWLVPAQVNREFKYYNHSIHFKKAEKLRLLDLVVNDYNISTVEPSNLVSFLFTRTTVKGEKIFASESYGLYHTTSLGVMHQMRWKDVYDGLIDESTSEDSVQVLAVAWPTGATTKEEDELFTILRYIRSEEDSSVFATTLDSVMNVVTDEAGNIKDKFYFMDARRIPGYDIKDYQ